MRRIGGGIPIHVVGAEQRERGLLRQLDRLLEPSLPQRFASVVPCRCALFVLAAGGRRARQVAVLRVVRWHSSFQSLPATGVAPGRYGLPLLISICVRPFHQPADAMPVVAARQRLLSMDTHWVLVRRKSAARSCRCFRRASRPGSVGQEPSYVFGRGRRRLTSVSMRAGGVHDEQHVRPHAGGQERAVREYLGIVSLRRCAEHGDDTNERLNGSLIDASWLGSSDYRESAAIAADSLMRVTTFCSDRSHDQHGRFWIGGQQLLERGEGDTLGLPT